MVFLPELCVAHENFILDISTICLRRNLHSRLDYEQTIKFFKVAYSLDKCNYPYGYKMQLSNNDRLKKANELSHGLNDLVACSHANDGGFDRKIAGGSKMIQGEMKSRLD